MGLDIQGRLQTMCLGCEDLWLSTKFGVMGTVLGTAAAVHGVLALPFGSRGHVRLSVNSLSCFRVTGMVIPNLFAMGIKLLNPQAAFPSSLELVHEVKKRYFNNIQGVLSAKVFQFHLKTMGKIESKRNWIFRQTIVKLTEPLFLISYVAARSLDAIAGLFGALVVLVKRGQTKSECELSQSPLLVSKQSMNWNTWTYRQLQITQLLADVHLCAMRFINADTIRANDLQFFYSI